MIATYGNGGVYGHGGVPHPVPVLRIIDDAQGSVFTLDEARAQCQVVPIDADSDGNLTHPNDGQLLAFLAAAVQAAEDFTGLCIAVRTYEMALDYFPDSMPRPPALTWPFYAGTPQRRAAIELPTGPLISVLEFTTGAGSDLVTLEEGVDFEVDQYHLLPLLLPVSVWAPLPASPNNIKVRFQAGFSPDTDGNDTVPQVIKQAILLMLADWYDHRDDSSEKQQYLIPNGAQALLRPRRVRLGMA